MNKRTFEKHAPLLLEQLPGYVNKGFLIYAEPLGHVLRGFYCEGSGFSRTSFAITYFALPLYVPTEYVYFTLGDRLHSDSGQEQWWESDAPDVWPRLARCMRAQGLSYLAGTEHPSRLIELAKELPDAIEVRRSQFIAYSHARLSQADAAIRELDHLLSCFSADIAWQRVIADRAQFLRDMLRSDDQQVQQQLDAWERETIANLGLAPPDK